MTDPQPDQNTDPTSDGEGLTRRRALAAAAGGVAVVAGGSAFALLRDGGSAGAASSSRTYQRYRTRRDLRPPRMSITKSSSANPDRFVFLSPKKQADNDEKRGLDDEQTGNMILDESGQLVYWHRMPTGLTPFDFRAQTYRGRSVLTWWEGTTLAGYGPGEGVILDSGYREIARVRMTDGLKFDFHEFRITPRNTALVAAYQRRTDDLRSVGGSSRGRILDNVVQEIDIATGKALFTWRASDHVSPAESYEKRPSSSKDPWDVFHINTVFPYDDATLLVSFRHTHSLFRIDRATGAVVWRLGGKRSDFRMGSGTDFAWQHDCQRRADGTITLFDNATDTAKSRRASRGLVLRVDEAARTCSLVKSYPHPGRRVTAATQGNVDDQPGGDVFIGWGGGNRIASQLTAAGALRFEARIDVPAYESYRAYRETWTGVPTTKPDVEASHGKSRTSVWASWNGATAVAKWRVLAGDERTALKEVSVVPRRGFETFTTIGGRPKLVAVEALDGRGNVLGSSRSTAA